MTLKLDIMRGEQEARDYALRSQEAITRDWAERRTLERQRYERERYDREHPPAQQQSDPIGHYIAIGVFATFPEARRWLLISCGAGLLLSIILVGFVAVIPNVGAVFILFCLGLGGLSIAAFFGLWIPSTVAAYVVPKMKDRWLGTEEEEEEEEDE